MPFTSATPTLSRVTPVAADISRANEKRPEASRKPSRLNRAEADTEKNGSDAPPRATTSGTVRSPAVSVSLRAMPVELYAITTSVTENLSNEGKSAPVSRNGVPETCRASVPLDLIKAPTDASRTPTSKDPTFRLALAPVTTMLRSSPRFWKPKSPDNRTDPPITASKPFTTTAMVLPGTSIGAVTDPTVSDCFTATFVEL